MQVGGDRTERSSLGHEQELHGHEDFCSGTPSIACLKPLLVLAVKLGHMVASGNCSGAFFRAPVRRALR